MTREKKGGKTRGSKGTPMRKRQLFFSSLERERTKTQNCYLGGGELDEKKLVRREGTIKEGWGQGEALPPKTVWGLK